MLENVSYRFKRVAENVRMAQFLDRQYLDLSANLGKLRNAPPSKSRIEVLSGNSIDHSKFNADIAERMHQAMLLVGQQELERIEKEINALLNDN